MENIGIKDFLNYKYIYNLKLSNDRKNINFIVSQMNIKDNLYESNIWNYNLGTKKTKQLTINNRSDDYIWLDNETLLIPSKDVLEKKTTFYKFNMFNGKKEEFFTIPLLVKSFDKIDENSYLVSASYNNYYEDYNDYDDKENGNSPKSEYMKDFYVFDEIPFWHNDKGITSKIRNRLYIYNKKSNDITPITDRYMDVYSPVIKGKKILYRAQTIKNKIEITSGIYIYDMETKVTDNIVKEDVFNIAHINFLGDNVVFIGTDMKKYGVRENMQIYIVRNNEIEKLTNMDKFIKTAIVSDSRYKKKETVKSHENKLFFTITENYDSQICSIDSSGNFEKVTDLKGSYDDYIILDDEIIFIGMRDMGLQEIYSYKANNTVKITDLNESVVSNKNIITPEKFVYQSNGCDITGFVLKPSEFDSNKKYPGVLSVHGGPKSTYGEVYYHDMQCLANAGYFVFFTNPHGSGARGNEFADIRGKYGSVDYGDLMNFTDEVIKRYENLDQNRLGVMGGSYGGFMTNWIIGHTDRFKSAVSEKGIASWVSKFATTDIGITTNAEQQASNPWSNHEKMWYHSPLKYADKVKTPTLFIHGEDDYRCWHSESILMYTSLMFNNVEAKLYLFKNENHGINRIGKPRNKIKRLEIILDWFEKHLK